MVRLSCAPLELFLISWSGWKYLDIDLIKPSIQSDNLVFWRLRAVNPDDSWSECSCTFRITLHMELLEDFIVQISVWSTLQEITEHTTILLLLFSKYTAHCMQMCCMHGISRRATTAKMCSIQELHRILYRTMQPAWFDLPFPAQLITRSSCDIWVFFFSSHKPVQHKLSFIGLVNSTDCMKNQNFSWQGTAWLSRPMKSAVGRDLCFLDWLFDWLPNVKLNVKRHSQRIFLPKSDFQDIQQEKKKKKSCVGL